MRIPSHTASAILYGYVNIQRLILMLSVKLLMKNELRILIIQKIKCQILCACYAEIINKFQLVLMRWNLLYGMRCGSPRIQKA